MSTSRKHRRSRLGFGVSVALVVLLAVVASSALGEIKQRDELTVSNGAFYDKYGSGVAVDGHTMVVSAPNRQVGSNERQGALYVYSDEETGAWQQVATLTADDGAAQDVLGGTSSHGTGVAISGNTIVAPVPGRQISSSSSQGCAYVFTRKGSNASGWAQATQTELRASDAPVGKDCDGTQSGAIAISGDRLAFSGPRSIGIVDSQQRYNGSVYVFKRTGNDWGQTQEITAGDACCDELGWSLAMSSNRLVIPNPTSTPEVYVYTLNGGQYDKTATLTPTVPSYSFSNTVAISGDTVIVGAALGSPNSSGAVYVFNNPSGATHEAAILTDSEGVAYNGGNLGLSLVTDGSSVMAGAPKQPAKGHTAADATNFTGMVDVWTKPSSGGWKSDSSPFEVYADDDAPGNAFGTSLAATDKEFFVGAPNQTVGSNTLQGATYVFGTASRVNLKVDETGSGDGDIKSDPRGINCGKNCKASFDQGANVKLIADPSKHSKFDGWSGGGCKGKDPKCKLSMTESKSVKAKFVNK